MTNDPAKQKVDISKLYRNENNKLKVFIVTRKADWCEDDAIAVLAVDRLHAERCARCNSSDFAKGDVKVTEIKMDKEKVILVSNMGA